MTEDDRNAFDNMLGPGAMLYGIRLDRVQFNLWWKLCKHLSLGAFMRAMEGALAERNRWPTPADILRAARKEPGQHEGGPRRLDAPSDPIHAKEAFALIHEITRTRMQPAQRLARFRDMAKRGPGKGWEDAVEKTQMLVDVENVPL